MLRRCRNLDKGLQTDVAILDFSKAFDKVPHDRLLYKLDCYGIRGNLHAWIKAFLTNRQMRVIVENEASAETTVHSGVPQGTVLGPLLFLVHINDLPDRVRSSIVRLFADDCLLYRTSALYETTCCYRKISASLRPGLQTGVCTSMLASAIYCR